MPQYTIKEVTSEQPKGPKGYTKLSVFTEESKFPQFVVDFSNKQVFGLLKDAKPGEVYDITVGKNDKGYDTWTAASKVAAKSEDAKTDSPRGSWGTKSTYETPEERAIKQLYIVRQSSISNALELLKVNNPKGGITVDQVLDVAQDFVDFVYGNQENLGTSDTVNEDIPY